jgi:predicted HTH transcriptional regulator
MEGRGTGIPSMNRVLLENGSPKAIFDTDGTERRYFIVEIPIHPAFKHGKNGY